MSNLSKIKNLAKSLYNEFNETAAGQGYLMLLKMIEKEDNAVPYSISSLRKSILDEVNKYGIVLPYFSIDIKIWGDRVNFVTTMFKDHIDENSPANFYKKCIEIIEKNAEMILNKQRDETSKQDISFK